MNLEITPQTPTYPDVEFEMKRTKDYLEISLRSNVRTKRDDGKYYLWLHFFIKRFGKIEIEHYEDAGNTYHLNSEISDLYNKFNKQVYMQIFANDLDINFVLDTDQRSEKERLTSIQK